MPSHEIALALQARGFAVAPASLLMTGRDVAPAWAGLQRLVGQWPVMLERQPIRAVAGGRSFASSNVFAPFHTDSQDFLGAPPALQILICHRAAEDGGASRLLDTWALLDRVEKGDPTLFSALFTEPRRIPFYFGDVTGPTVACKRGHLVFTHSPMPPRDPIGMALAPWIERSPHEEVALRAGDMLLVDNHRMLHGRCAFDDPHRDLTRVLAWLPRSIAEHVHYMQMTVRRREEREVPRDALRVLAVVAEMLSGTPPGVLAAREDVPEAELYRWRNIALEAALHALRSAK